MPAPCGALTVPLAIDFHRRHLGGETRLRCHTRAVALMDTLARRFGIEPIGGERDFAQMAPIPVPAVGDGAALRERLFSRHRIEVPVTQHGERRFVRVSVQGYNTEDDLGRLHDALVAECGGG